MFGLSYLTITSIIIGAFAIFPHVMRLFRKNQFEVEGKTILVTGASQGTGKSVAIQLSAKGANVIIVARNIKKLETALEEIKASALNPSTQRFHYISNDLTTAEGNIKTVEDATRWNNGRAPDTVWCVAGDSFPQFFLETDIETLRWQMDMNYWASAYMAHTILKSWLAPDSPSKGTERHLIFTCSTVAFYPVIGYNTYSPAKAAMRNLSDGLSQEVLIYGENVKLHTIFPGNISSPGFENEGICKPDITLKFDEADPPQTPDEVAQISIKGLERGEAMICTNFLAQAMRAQMWSGMPKNNWLWDTLFTYATSIAWPFISWDMNGQVVKYGKKHGHPSNYVKRKN